MNVIVSAITSWVLKNCKFAAQQSETYQFLKSLFMELMVDKINDAQKTKDGFAMISPNELKITALQASRELGISSQMKLLIG